MLTLLTLSYNMALGSGGAGGASAPPEKIRGCAAPPGNFREPQKA